MAWKSFDARSCAPFISMQSGLYLHQDFSLKCLKSEKTCREYLADERFLTSNRGGLFTDRFLFDGSFVHFTYYKIFMDCLNHRI